jgi:hypothetical protein
VIKWFEGNPVGGTFASICAGLLLVSLLLAVFWSLPPSAPLPESGDEEAALVLDVPELDDSEPLEAYTVITERPVFNASRQPVIEEDTGEDDSEELLAEEEVDAPEVQLSGVIITPDIRMVTLKTKDQSESLVAFEGMPLEGDYGSWQVSNIEEREITLSSDSGEELQLKLQVHDVKIEEPPELEPDEDEDEGDDSADAEPAVAGDGDQPLSRAEEIRQRIAQRREELRRAAEEKEQDPDKETNYSAAIQSMISGSKRKQEQDENEN